LSESDEPAAAVVEAAAAPACVPGLISELMAVLGDEETLPKLSCSSSGLLSSYVCAGAYVGDFFLN